jgi:lipoprotein Spr
MLMKKLILLFTVACSLFSTVLVSCSSGKHTTYHKSSKQPKFIEDVYIAPHNKSNETANAIDTYKPTEKKKQRSYGHAHKAEPIVNNIQTTSKEQIIVRVPTSKVDKVAAPTVVQKKYSEMLGIDAREITNFTLYQFIDKWYGTDYRLGGRDKKGIDCSGFAQRLYYEVYGIDLLRTSTEQFSNCKRIKHSKDAEEGDLVFFHVRSKRITHVGVYLANDYFVHASTSNGVMISNLNEEYWHKYYAGCGRVPRGG